MGLLKNGQWFLILFLIPSLAHAGDLSQFQAGDAKRGWQVFQTKGCMNCHKIGDNGKMSIGPDLAKLASTLNAADLAASMWNHAPQMWIKTSEHAFTYQPLEKQEAVDLFAFIFFLRYMEDEGDPKRGKIILETKSCTACHSLGGKGGGAAPDITEWSGYVNPLAWLQKMWQHAPQMLSEMRRRGLNWPTFEGREMVDVISYVRSLGAKNETSYLRTGDPANGKILLAGKGCTKCHGQGRGPDLGPAHTLPPTIGQLAGAIWNHAPQMVSLMALQGIERPSLSPGELADIVAYLFASRFIEPPGNAKNGENIFAEKGCSSCHTVTTSENEGLKPLKRSSVAEMAQGLWNHGPKMLEAMKQRGINWPALSGSDMADLIAFFKARGDK